ncbi:MAG: 1-deoxy-D-xylulose-5-phosphate reductoisomerase [Caldimicrobium sp.]|nr:1-deoxy-D-xylulose-5-phosphate reductoisomerase [Caldimicrobium sp.]MDW8183511.1 1-deoxy-D-xylulose-5-phosphate reductoisomerase [Caldimicrobium sp.]
MKNVVILGSTGSIGTSAIEVIKEFPHRFRILGLSAKTNLEKLKLQAETFKVPYLAIEKEEVAKALQSSLSYPAEVYVGDRGLAELAQLDEADIVLISVSGIKGLIPAYYALKSGKRVALANKECLVAAGDLLKNLIREHGGDILPVDSEHSALFQLLKCDERKFVKRIILTASGGPFLNWDIKNYDRITPEMALKHPTWQMGPRITIDSATLMNKGLEVIEAQQLFDFPLEAIEVIVHPQSIIHSLVELKDGSMLAHLSQPDMRLAISYALNYPERSTVNVKPLDLTELASLTFHKVDHERFPSITLAYEAARKGHPYPLILEASDEALVEAFLKGIISFREIPYFIEKIINEFKFTTKPEKDPENYLDFHRQVKDYTLNLIERKRA